MKINKIFSFGLSFVALAFAATSCTDDFEEINTNPNGPVTVPSDLLLTSMQERTADLLYAMQIGGDMGGNLIQHWGKVQYNDEERYDFRPGNVNTIWNNLYAGNLTDAQSMIELATEEGNEKNQGIAKIWQAYLFSTLAELYGPVPFTEALKAKEGITSPAYDNEETVYQGVMTLYDEGLALLNGAGEISESQDLIFGGDVTAWKKFGNSLKFRTLMRISDANVSGIDVSGQLQAIINSGMHFTSNADNALLRYTGNNPNANPIWNTIVFGTRSEYKVNATLVEILTDLNDSRLPIYAQENSTGEIRGVPPGILNPVQNGYDYANVSAIGELFLASDYPATYMDYSELMFLVAEAAHRNLITGVSPAEAYEAGIAASFSRYGAPNAEAYIASVAYNSATGLEQIGTQKWIALYGQGIEAWTEWRRTGFPELDPALDPVVGTQIPSRYPYPTNEQTLNTANYQAAVSLLGEDALSSKLIFVK